LAEASTSICILKRASISSLVMGFWGIIVFVVLLPNVNMSILDLLSTQGYPRTYPALFLFYAMNYTILAAITAPILIFFSYYSYRIGSNLKVASLRGAGLTWSLLSVATLAFVPFVYQDALNMISSYEAAIANGILPDYAFTPLGLYSIQYAVPVSMLFATVSLMLVSAEMKMKVRLNGFMISWVFALLAALLALPGWLDGLALLAFSIASIAFGFELRRLAPNETE
jgi:hypothetical protein